MQKTPTVQTNAKTWNLAWSPCADADDMVILRSWQPVANDCTYIRHCKLHCQASHAYYFQKRKGVHFVSYTPR